MMMRTTDATLLVAESNSDTNTLAHLLDDNVRLQKGQGKVNCVGAHQYLNAEERKRALFLVDCDGEDNDAILGKEGLVVSQNRDLEADLFFCLSSFENIIVSKLAVTDGDVRHFRTEARACLEFATDLATQVGLIRDLAARRRMRVKVWDKSQGKKRKIGIRDISNVDDLCGGIASTGLEQIVAEFAGLLDWTVDEQRELLSISASNASHPCRMHTAQNCPPCKARRFANGHELVDIGARLLALRFGDDSEEADFVAFEKSLRLSPSPFEIQQWNTLRRFRRFEEWSGTRILREYA